MEILLETNPLYPAHGPASLAGLIPLVFLCMRLLVTGIISRCGWVSFSNRHRASSRPSGTAYNCQVLTFGSWVRYKNAVRVIFTDSGVYFFPIVLFKLFHPPFMVPWASVVDFQMKDSLFGPYAWLEINDPVGRIRIRLTAKAENNLVKYREVMRLSG